MSLICFTALGQKPCDIEFEGHVFDEHTNEGIPYVLIILNQSEYTAYTNDGGRFLIANLCPGKYAIEIHISGEVITTDTLQITREKHKDYPIEIHAEMLDAVEVKAERQEKKQVIQPNIEPKANTFDGALASQLQGASGVTIQKVGNNVGKPILLGLGGSRILILKNGVRLESQSWGDEHAPEIDPFSAESITVLTGSQAQRYGNSAIGGVVLLSAPNISDSLISGKVASTYNTNGQGSFNNIEISGKPFKNKNFGYSFQGSYGISGNQKTPSYYLSNTGSRSYAYNGLLKYQNKRFTLEAFYSGFNNELGVLSDAHIGNLTDLNNAIERGRPIGDGTFSYYIQRPFQRVNHQLGKVQADYNWNDVNTTRLMYGWQRNLRKEFDSDRRESLLPELDLDLTTNTVEALHTYSKNQLHEYEFGYFGRYQTNVFSGRYFIPNFALNNHSGFASYRYKHKGSEFKTGVRYDYQDISAYFPIREREKPFKNSYSNFNGVVEWSSHILKHLSYALSASNSWRAPDVNELFSNGVHHGSAAYEIGNENLSAEKAYSTQIGLKYLLEHKFILATQFNYTYFDNYIFLKPALRPTLTIRGSFPTFIYEQIPAHFYNLNSYIKGPITGNIDFRLQHDFIYAENTSDQNFLINIPPTRYQSWLNFKIKKYTFSWHSIYINKQWRVAPELDYAPVPESYWINNLSFSYEYEFKGNKLLVGVNAQNVFNQLYKDYLNRFRYFTHETGRAIIFNLSYRFE